MSKRSHRAVAHIWPSLKCKIYATPFTAALILENLKKKLIFHRF